MRTTAAIFAATLILVAACSEDSERATPTSEAATTEPPVTLSNDARRTVIRCVEAQADVALSLGAGFDDDDENATMQDLCDEAAAYIDVEAPRGDNVARRIATALATNRVDLSTWALDVSLTGAPASDPNGDGVTPFEAGAEWRSTIRDLIDDLPD